MTCLMTIGFPNGNPASSRPPKGRQLLTISQDTMDTSTNGEIPAAFRWIFCIGFMFIGLVFLILGGYQLLQGLKTTDWPAAPGKILSSQVQSGNRSSGGPVRIG